MVRSSQSYGRGHTESERPTVVCQDVIVLTRGPVGGPISPVHVVSIRALPVFAHNDCDLHLLHPTLSDTSGRLQLVLGTVIGIQQPANIRLSLGCSDPRMERIQRDCGAGQALT